MKYPNYDSLYYEIVFDLYAIAGLHNLLNLRLFYRFGKSLNVSRQF